MNSTAPSVIAAPGHTALIRTPSGAASAAIERVMPAMACLEVV